MLGNGQLEQLLGSIGALNARVAIAWMTYCGLMYVLSDLKTDYAKLPYLEAWTSVILGMIFTGTCITGLACCVSLAIKSALFVTRVISKMKSR